MSLKSELESRILYLTLNRPERGNSLDPFLLCDLRIAFLDAQTNPKIKAILLTGAGQKDFCTGIDTTYARDLPNESKLNIANVAGDIATLIYMGKPTVIAINGRFMGMGVVFSAAADYRCAAPDTIFQMPEVNFGIFPGANCTAIMTRVCGISWTRRMLMSGQPFNSQEGIAAQIIDEIIPKEKLIEKATNMAKELSKKNPINLSAIKFAINTNPYLKFPLIGNPEQLLEDCKKYKPV
jgi:enoyl-CoA hydratase/carnithine racemase